MSSPPASPSPSPEDKAMQQLQSEHFKLLDKIDELRTIGVGGLVALPQLIVCGDQSSGKSSVLEAISRVRFPIKSSVCTRFPTEVVLRRNPSPKIKVSIEPGESRTEEQKQDLRNFTHDAFSNSKDLGDLITEATERMGLKETDAARAFSHDVLKIEISGPDKPELTLVDLPGLYANPSEKQGAEGIKIVLDLTRKYMRNPRSIILAVINAKNNIHLQKVLKIAEEHDPQRERTLGIITQPDRLDGDVVEEDYYLQAVRNERTILRLGWHALRNRRYEEQGADDDKRDETERVFFEKGRWASVSREYVGIDSLRRRLSCVLLQHVQCNLPDLITDIKVKIADRQQRLARLGEERSTVQQQRGFLLNISRRFEQITEKALNGMYTDEFFVSNDDGPEDVQNFCRLRAIIRDLNEDFVEAMEIRGCCEMINGSTAHYALTSTNDRRSSNPYMNGFTANPIAPQKYEKKVINRARIERGIELPGSPNQVLVGKLFREQSKPWEEIASQHLLKSWNAVNLFVRRVIRYLADEHTYFVLVSTALAPALKKLENSIMDKLDELTKHSKRGHPLPIGKAFLYKIQESRTDRQVLTIKKELSEPNALFPSVDDNKTVNIGQLDAVRPFLKKDGDRFAAADIIDQMQAYYDTAIVTFMENIAVLAIENCLLEPLKDIFSSHAINGMNEERIRELAAEQPHIQNDRDNLRVELQQLKAGLNVFSVYNSEGSSPPPPPIFVERVVRAPDA
ncbi:hypothetical protein FE257_009740 [Aspergillus nanangensis]|uniref:Dynamin family protein n=1 Tax=Aspergillus nanangensis TaxID=2582783 RepID=A0AAD4CJX2_ASPNN|nr:hypothetical protein FE257_009740 [Aspergillus nanangensis]